MIGPSSGPATAPDGDVVAAGVDRPGRAPSSGDPEERVPDEPWVAGDLVDGRYRLVAPEGRGAFGEVWHARDLRLAIPVAIKILGPELAAVAEFRRRFEREARATAALHGEHHVIQIYDYHPEFPVYLVMRYIPGRNLNDLIMDEGSGGLAPQRAVAIVCQVADALDHAHKNGLVHRDVKPTNVLVDRNGDAVHLADFGIVAAIDDDVLTKLTAQGFGGLGTPRYMSPEQIGEVGSDARRMARRQRPSVSMDVYSITCVLYECLTGQHAYPQRGRDAVERAHREGRRPRPSDAVESLTPFDGVVVRGLAADPARRTRSAEAFAQELREALRVWVRQAGTKTVTDGLGPREEVTRGRAPLPVAEPVVAEPAVGEQATQQPDPVAEPGRVVAEPEPEPVVAEPEPEPVVAEQGPVVAEPDPVVGKPVAREPGPVEGPAVAEASEPVEPSDAHGAEPARTGGTLRESVRSPAALFLAGGTVGGAAVAFTGLDLLDGLAVTAAAAVVGAVCALTVRRGDGKRASGRR